MSFPTKDERTKCWASRDIYWQCLDEHNPKHAPSSGEIEPEQCKQLRKIFVNSCPGQWVKHFDRKRTYELFKEKVQNGYDPLEEQRRSPPPKTSQTK